MKNILLTILLILTIQIVNSQDTVTVKYFPVNIGNTWVYTCTGNGVAFCNCVSKTKVKITQIIQKYGRFYYIFSSQTNIIVSCPLGCRAALMPDDTLRIDSNSCNIYKFVENYGCSYSPHEVLYDSLKAKLNDYINLQCSGVYGVKCSDTSNITLFGILRKSKTFGSYGVDSHSDRKYVKGIGASGGSGSAMACQSTRILNGCVIDGLIYGDTSYIVGVNQISNLIPENYNLYQNYPNPFNPSTSITYSIPKLSIVKLIVYDVLGNEISILVNEELVPGTYEAKWDAKDYPSGLYFYKLECDGFNDVKKMVFIK